MHRQPLLNSLGEYVLRYPEEQEVYQRLKTFVEQNEDCFRRELLTGHITGSAWIVSRDGSKTLLTHHRKLDRWLQPGGHADGEADVRRVAMREAEEESGLASLILADSGIFDIDIHLIPERGDEPSHYHYDCRFLIRCEGPEAYVVSDESHDLSWVPVEEIERYTTEESVLRMARKMNLIQG